jgi:hypothetical protein
MVRHLVLFIVILFGTTISAEDRALDPAVQRLLARFQTTNGQGDHRASLSFDGTTVLVLPKGTLSIRIDGTGAQRSLVVLSDGQENARVILPSGDLGLQNLPPLAVPDLDAVTVKSESRTVNGVSSTRVWLDQRLIYEGPGATSQTTTTSINGKRTTTVTVDGRVVYHIGEGHGFNPPAKAP